MDDKNNCKHKFRRIISGPMLVVDFCLNCRLEIVDIIDRGPNRLELAKNGDIITQIGGKNEKK